MSSGFIPVNGSITVIGTVRTIKEHVSGNGNVYLNFNIQPPPAKEENEQGAVTGRYSTIIQATVFPAKDGHKDAIEKLRVGNVVRITFSKVKFGISEGEYEGVPQKTLWINPLDQFNSPQFYRFGFNPAYNSGLELIFEGHGDLIEIKGGSDNSSGGGFSSGGSSDDLEW